ncbi:hypothetical protein SprV_0301138400 [Sparganum proliferum]
MNRSGQSDFRMIFHSPSRFTVSKAFVGSTKLTGGEDHVRGPTMSAEAALALRQYTLFEMVVEAVEKDASEDLLGDVQQGNATVVVAYLAVPFSLVEMHDGCILEILRDFILTPHLLEERSQVIH